jgi:hypothetical protein
MPAFDTRERYAVRQQAARSMWTKPLDTSPPVGAHDYRMPVPFWSARRLVTTSIMFAFVALVSAVGARHALIVVGSCALIVGLASVIWWEFYRHWDEIRCALRGEW